jgi:hypothetical protein
LNWVHSGTVFPTLQISSTFADSTQWFGTDNWVQPPNASADTVVYGAVIFEVDSTASHTPNLTVFTYLIQGSSDGTNVTSVFAPGTMTLTSGVKTFQVPIFFSAGTAARAAAKSIFPFSGNKKIRVVVSGTTGTMSGVKCSILRFAD